MDLLPPPLRGRGGGLCRPALLATPHAGGRHQELPLLANVSPYLDPLLMAPPNDANRSHAYLSLLCIHWLRCGSTTSGYGTRRFYLYSLA